MDFFSRLQKLPLFHHLTPKEFERITTLLRQNSKNVPKGKILHLKGDENHSLSILLSGSLKAELPSLEGKNLQLRKISAPGVMTPVFFHSSRKLPVMIRAAEESLITTLPQTELFRLLQGNTPFLEDYLTMIAQRISYLTEKIEFLSFNTIRKKIAWYLTGLESQGGTVILPQSLTELSDFFAVERPSLSKVFSDLVKEGIIQKEGHKKIRILDRERLEKEISL